MNCEWALSVSDDSVTTSEAEKILKGAAPLLKELREKERAYEATHNVTPSMPPPPAAPRCLAEGCTRPASPEGACANIICSLECLRTVLDKKKDFRKARRRWLRKGASAIA